jgi:hypothetical protein
MRLYLFEPRADAHIRKSREYLEEANIRRVEHQAAAEHHGALSRMYADRIIRLDAEIREAAGKWSSSSPTNDETPKESAHSKSDSVVPTLRRSRTPEFTGYLTDRWGNSAGAYSVKESRLDRF